MRNSPKAGLVAALLTGAALAAGCSSTVDGVAGCPGCGSTGEPQLSSTPSGPQPSQTAPSGSAPQPGGGQALPPNAAGYVYIETKSGKTRCQISAETVGCESEFATAPMIDGVPANGVEVSATGANRWVLGNLGAMPTTTIDYATYNAVGWSIVADGAGTTFTNDGTGHGMFVSTDRVNFF